MARLVAVVPHTHWDREWYSPYQTFRLKLVELLDELLPRLERDPSFVHFLLDGQMAVVDDYLEVRPEAEAAIRRLAASGRMSMGPWYILMDEFLVSGETMIRDLQLGLERAAAFGGAMEVGYLPDMFGHIAQMPQLLAQFGLRHAVLWRGTPSEIRRTGFHWEGPDGTTVRAEFLPQGYGNGAYLPDDPQLVLQSLHDFMAETEGMHGDGPVLWMNGGDHFSPKAYLGKVLEQVNALQGEYRMQVMSLPGYLEQAPSQGLPRWKGELRSGHHSNLLMGVASNRTDVRQASIRTERELEQLAEPLSALALSPEGWPERLLQLAWKNLILNSAHDSICACSHDDVVDAVLHRFAEARHIAEGLTQRALTQLARCTRSQGPVVLNPSARSRSGLVELWLHGDEPVPGTQVLERRDPTLFDLTLLGRELKPVIDQFRGRLHDSGFFVADVKVDGADAALTTVKVTFQRTLDPSLHPKDARTVLGELVQKRAEQKVRVLGLRPPAQRVLAHASGVPGYGWSAWTPAPLPLAPATAQGHALSNGRVRLEVSPQDGTFTLVDLELPGAAPLAGLGRLVDDGDAGDTYNYSPPAKDVRVERPESVRVQVLESGPLRAALRVDRTYRWPSRIENGARVGEVTALVQTRLELCAGERLVRVEVTLDNTARDHRLRVHLPLPSKAQRSEAECAFAIVERGLTAEGGPTEYGLPTFPSRRFVRAGGLTAVHEGLTEYELLGNGTELALTLLRCTGVISQREMTYRPLPAGPSLPLEGPQMQGVQTLRFGVQLGAADPYALVEQAFLPLTCVDAPGTGTEGPRGQLLHVEGAEVSALTRKGGQLELRVFNPGKAPTRVQVRDAAGRPLGGWQVDLRGRTQGRFDGALELRGAGIATLRLEA